MVRMVWGHKLTLIYKLMYSLLEHCLLTTSNICTLGKGLGKRWAEEGMRVGDKTLEGYVILLPLSKGFNSRGGERDGSK